MPQNWKRPLISAREAEIITYLEEVRELNDLDLWEEVAAKINDVLLVYRRAMARQIVKFNGEIDERIRIPEAELKNLVTVYRRALETRTFTFSDGVTRNVDAMALSHAAAQVAEEFGDEDVIED